MPKVNIQLKKSAVQFLFNRDELTSQFKRDLYSLIDSNFSIQNGLTLGYNTPLLVKLADKYGLVLSRKEVHISRGSVWGTVDFEYPKLPIHFIK